MLKCYFLSYVRPPQKNLNQFLAFFGHFNLFHLTILLQLQKPDLRNLPETRFWLLLVNNQLCNIPPSWATSDINNMAGKTFFILVIHTINILMFFTFFSNFIVKVLSTLWKFRKIFLVNISHFSILHFSYIVIYQTLHKIILFCIFFRLLFILCFHTTFRTIWCNKWHVNLFIAIFFRYLN